MSIFIRFVHVYYSVKIIILTWNTSRLLQKMFHLRHCSKQLCIIVVVSLHRRVLKQKNETL